MQQCDQLKRGAGGYWVGIVGNFIKGLSYALLCDWSLEDKPGLRVKLEEMLSLSLPLRG